MRLVLLGGPGSGKSTQSNNLSQQLNLPVISMGGILRDAITSATPLGIKAKSYVEKGDLLPDPIMIEFIQQRLGQEDGGQGWIVEGYPRTAFQAEELDFLLEDLGQPLDWALHLKIDEATMVERSLNRSLFDDHPEVVTNRIGRFHEYTIPLLEYYDAKKKLLTVNAHLEVDQVTKLILSQF
ncbi:nucleoside monophosphate kinase [Synechocystis sp. PCC 7338]|uniref:adenylate kinase family protein n=1 Tax=Synechocystis sp. PCC 7338 TaxID=2732530 RepID=UPI001BAE9B81|nr:nucleoside monophosphate kinase [Synechocystis sp. PCC 7338]QUS60261.1 nucleoside monophosphate kinase [Synechocystis sp. PCC 7338]